MVYEGGTRVRSPHFLEKIGGSASRPRFRHNTWHRNFPRFSVVDTAWILIRILSKSSQIRISYYNINIGDSISI